METTLLLLGTGLLAGAMNALAGGGSFVTLPALILAGIPPTAANATSTVALFPGSLASAWALRRDWRPLPGVPPAAMVAVSLLGGLVGALLLLLTPERSFSLLVPWLLLLGAVAFAWGGAIGRRLRRRWQPGPRAILAGQGLLAVYGGYFGGAKSLLVGATNGAAVLCFIAAGKVSWGPGLVLLLAATAGGYGGACLSRRLDPMRLRRAIVGLNFLMATAFLYRAYA